MNNLRDTMMNKAALGAASIAAVLVLTGCASPSNSDRAELGEVDDGFPALADNWYDGGQFVDPDSVLRIAEGQSKDQVRQLIGNPHYAEGFFGVREWNYVFNLYTGNGNEYITCQYQVHYGDDMTLESTRWRNAQCPALLIPIEVEEIAAEPREEKLTLSGDVLFDFDSDTLTLEGQRALERVSEIASDAYSSPNILVVGYTDRFGKEQYNLNLSQARAEAVGSYLVSQGIERRNLMLLGRGEADPIVDCPGQVATRSVKECLKPNRRVEMTLK
ncbi:OmpA family protein [Vreelandella venusta]|uniref:OmpA family protein n=1 Tax=Vreelandella venusta TaxID=44935 RepID=UPI002286973D|nr:OmpA family protein [Halomonas venusta]WAM47950.1 OmpA family protein [Halomonas venusta]WAM51435.1 OmpA family protein [Halomonas venusta]WAM54949.1 OmpA family protein [Halomonas venusta]